MKQIPLPKRILYYVLLFFITLPGIGLIYLSLLVHNFDFIIALISVCLIPHYIFGSIFLKTKRIFKLIVPFVTSIVSFVCACLIAEITIDIIDSDILIATVLLFPIIFVWEIAYQILKRCLNKNSSSQNQMSEL